MTAAESFHAHRSAVGDLREASHEVGLAIARFTLSTMSIKDHKDFDIDMANYEVILKQISAAQAVCKKFYTYRNGEAVRWLQDRPYSTGPRADADLLALKTAAKQLSDLLSVSPRVKSTAA
ncbi:MAG: hypothetical protein EOO38_11345 [Cytophagaceae bacterium]|nr:MAG: hypothetical protein EOO38_11345 [Cytophagaceae bacterium]